MAENPEIGKNCTPANANLGCIPLAYWARELFKPSKDGEVL